MRAMIDLLKAIVRFANQVEGTFETLLVIRWGPKQGFSAP